MTGIQIGCNAVAIYYIVQTWLTLDRLEKLLRKREGGG